MERECLLIDTSILIDHLRKTQKDKTIFYKLTLYYDFVISAITEFEFLIGSTDKNRQFTKELLESLPVLDFDQVC